MKPEDTIISEEQIVEAEVAYMNEHELNYFPLRGEHRDNCIKEAQAEVTWDIAFKAGFDEGRTAGIREVVEFLQKNRTTYQPSNYGTQYWICENDLKTLFQE